MNTITIRANEPVIMPQLTIEQLRSFNPEISNLNNIENPNAKYNACYVTDDGKEGIFKLDILYNRKENYSINILDEDDGVITIVAYNNTTKQYYKFVRIIEKYVNIKWFGVANSVKKINQLSASKIEELRKLFNKYAPFENASSILYNNPNSVDITMKNWQDNTIDWAVLQTAINYCVNSSTNKTLFIPLGNYYISRELFIRKVKTNTTYGQCQIVIEGESSYSGAVGSTINALFNDKFALGVQEGRGIKIKGLSFNGQFTRDNNVVMGDRAFYSSTLETEGKNSYNRFFKPCKDRRYGPYAAIVLDPFRTSQHSKDSIKNFDEYYTELSYYYSKKCGTSSGTEITDVQFNGFIAGIVFSPNGLTQGDDVSKIEKAKFSNLKYGVCFSQDQEKTNTIRHIYAWSNVHTLIASSSQKSETRVGFGQGRAGNQIIEDVNIAGNVNQFIYREDGGTFAMFIKNVFAERLGKIGYLGSQVGGSFENSEIGFPYPIKDNDTSFEGYYPEWHLKGYGYTFKNCLIRYYTEGDKMKTPISIFGNFKFENCVFTTVPFYSQSISTNESMLFTNCKTTLEGDLGFSGIKTTNPVHLFENIAYGNFILNSSIDKSNNKQILYTNDTPFEIFGFNKVSINTINKNGDISIPIKKDDYDNYYKFGKLVVYTTEKSNERKPLGIIKKYDSANNNLIISGVSEAILNNELFISCIIPITTIEPFFGDIKKGNNCNRIYNITKNNFVFNFSSSKNINLKNYIGKAVSIANAGDCSNRVEIKENDFRPLSSGRYVVIKEYDSKNNEFIVTPYTAKKEFNNITFCNGCETVNQANKIKIIRKN